MSAENLPGKENFERQRWEYKFLERSREIKTGWGAIKAELGGTHALGWGKDITFSMIEALGEKGWELMAVVPRSSLVNAAGFTSEELWVFKRPK